MQRRYWVASLIGIVSVVTSGCFSTHQLLHTEVPQAAVSDVPREVVLAYLKSKRFYQFFETRAHFDALWMSDDISSLYAKLNAIKTGKSNEEHEAFLLRQLEENNHWMRFYVLADIQDQSHISLNDSNSAWSLYLRTKSGNTITPLSVKEVSLEPEIQYIFGAKLSPFKTVYLIKFPTKNIAGIPYFSEKEDLELVVASAGMQDSLTWKVAPRGTHKELMEKHSLKKRNESSFFSFFKGFKDGKTCDDDFYW